MICYQNKLSVCLSHIRFPVREINLFLTEEIFIQ